MHCFAKKHQRQDTGFSILEVVISGVIFSIVAVGAYSTVSALKTPASASKEEITAAYVGKQVFEDLRGKVDAEDWTIGAGGPLDPYGGSSSNGIYTLSDITIDGTAYTPVYQVTDDSITTARKVSVTVTW